MASGLVLTAAHVVAGARSIEIRHGARSMTGTVVGFDPDMDLAHIAVDASRPVRPIHATTDRVQPGAQGTALVVRDGETVSVPITITRRVRIRTEDVYVEGETLRPGYELAADIRPGDSGAAIVIDGRLAGVVWATSRRSAGRSYAIDPVRAGDRLAAQLAAADLGAGGDPVDLTRCP